MKKDRLDLLFLESTLSALSGKVKAVSYSAYILKH